MKTWLKFKKKNKCLWTQIWRLHLLLILQLFLYLIRVVLVHLLLSFRGILKRKLLKRSFLLFLSHFGLLFLAQQKPLLLQLLLWLLLLKYHRLTSLNLYVLKITMKPEHLKSFFSLKVFHLQDPLLLQLPLLEEFQEHSLVQCVNLPSHSLQDSLTLQHQLQPPLILLIGTLKETMKS